MNLVREDPDEPFLEIASDDNNQINIMQRKFEMLENM
jgi:hypothetical protein